MPDLGLAAGTGAIGAPAAGIGPANQAGDGFAAQPASAIAAAPGGANLAEPEPGGTLQPLTSPTAHAASGIESLTEGAGAAGKGSGTGAGEETSITRQPGAGGSSNPEIDVAAQAPGGVALPPGSGPSANPRGDTAGHAGAGSAGQPGILGPRQSRTNPAAQPGQAILTLPNIISFARLCAVPFAIWLVLHQRFAAAFGFFVAAGISDAVDGWLARRHGGTALGAALDPLADKALMIGMFVTLAATGQLPDWLAILVVFRDVVIVGGVALLWATSHTVAIRPLMVSKTNTALQIVLVALVLGLDALGLSLEPLRAALVVLVTASTLASGAAYVIRTARHP